MCWDRGLRSCGSGIPDLVLSSDLGHCLRSLLYLISPICYLQGVKLEPMVFC